VKRLNLLRQPQVGRRRSRLFSIQVFLCANEIFYFEQFFYESDPQIRMVLHHLQSHTENITRICRARAEEVTLRYCGNTFLLYFFMLTVFLTLRIMC